MTQYYTTITLANGKRSELGRLSLCVTIDNDPQIFEFSSEDLKRALELLKANAEHFNNDDDGYRLDLFFADGFETKPIYGTQLGIAEAFVMKDFIEKSGIK